MSRRRRVGIKALIAAMWCLTLLALAPGVLLGDWHFAASAFAPALGSLALVGLLVDSRKAVPPVD